MKTEMITVYKPNFCTKKKLQLAVTLLDIGHLKILGGQVSVIGQLGETG